MRRTLIISKWVVAAPDAVAVSVDRTGSGDAKLNAGAAVAAPSLLLSQPPKVAVEGAESESRAPPARLAIAPAGALVLTSSFTRINKYTADNLSNFVRS